MEPIYACTERIYSFLVRYGTHLCLYGTHLFVPSSIWNPTELGTNKCVPYRQDGSPTELGTNKCVPYRIGCVPYRIKAFPTESLLQTYKLQVLGQTKQILTTQLYSMFQLKIVQNPSYIL